MKAIQYLVVLILGIMLMILTGCEQDEVCYKPVDLSLYHCGEATFSANAPCYLQVGDAWGKGYIVAERDVPAE